MHRGLGNLLSTAFRLSMLVVAAAAPVDRALAQNTNPFGLQDRADAASQMIVLGVQQGISSLPPTSGQAFTYDYNAELGTFVESEQLGPTVLRSTQTIGANRLSLRFATSYFELGETFDPIPYKATADFIPDDITAVTALGMSADANVVLFNFAGTYGFTDRIEATINIPFSVVDARASQTFLSFPPASTPPGESSLAAVQAVPNASIQQAYAAIDQGLLDGDVIYREDTFPALGADFESGKNVGLGRISVGVKGLVLATERFDLALSGEFFCNSPSEDQYAGSDSPSILPRAIAQLRAAKHLNLFTDVGYEYDFDVSSLRRFVWNAGLSVPIVNATFDAGVGGSFFDTSLTWTPTTATGGGENPVTITVFDKEQTELGKNYIDFLFGLKMRLFEGAVLAGAVNVPVTDDGFRAEAIGTVSLEYYFKL